ncbi:DNA mismatch repair protein MutL [Gottschalkia acidurici 9a]|uniref:DNA mismatch repair protein MutL n=1 Tax=Gottschalkia acidurici (strain ATCC 7906 / DSM 604 / BCRC 14475 / CIP 104303 / KCTC 5404 / NCIMB 10678 / 9a) TaxID=1128398 RepID=K0B0E0_GOTA9|nr:DNA mismatch repair endonuclease MutL [Gottschalkia acidurici]AFS78527.1 DNA mismatch repair protein MutL [Gottschalkia acidurici 9a]
MSKLIKLLDEKTINKIAAGEVVERPSSVVKELVENSIDAQSTSITIEIISGGKKYIRVTDNGVGISKKDIELAFLRHSTSKISKVEDLGSVNTLGFRGEALASISAVSQLEVITKTSSDLSGVKAIINGGVVREKLDVGCPKGTTLIVRNLFYNVPVRQKFLKSEGTEASYISDIVYKLALSNPAISFNYIKDNKQIVKTPGNGDMKSTVYSLLGKSFLDSTFELCSEANGIKIHGLISNTSFTRGNRSSQYIFVNGRYIKDENISRSVEDSYRTVIPSNRYPVFLIFIDIDSINLDVNVHPTKTEVRFSNKDIINKFLYNSVKDTLLSNNLIPKVSFSNKIPENKNKSLKEEQVILDIIDDSIKTASNIDAHNSFKKNSNIIKDNLSLYEQSTNTKVDIKNINENLKIVDFNMTESNEDKINENQCDSYENCSCNKSYHIKTNNTQNRRIPKLKIIGRLFDTYILGEDKVKNTLYLIDQHAAHERIMYEKFKYQLENQDVYIQSLMLPEVINLSQKEIDLVRENLSTFTKLGFNMEEFGNNAIILRGVPLVFGNPNSKTLLLDIIDNLEDGVKSNYDLLLEKIMKLACTSAIKAKDNIEDIEIEKLMEDLELTEEPFTCPHGRPIIIEITNYELEKKFKRT